MTKVSINFKRYTICEALCDALAELGVKSPVIHTQSGDNFTVTFNTALSVNTDLSVDELGYYLERKLKEAFGQEWHLVKVVCDAL